MPRIRPSTEAQRQEQRYQQRMDWIADGLAAYKRKNRMNNAEAANALGLGVSTVAKLLDAQDVQLKTKQMIRLIYACGLTIAQRKEVEL